MLIQCLSSCTRLSYQLITSPLYLRTGQSRSFGALNNLFGNGRNRLFTLTHRRPVARQSRDQMAMRRRKTDLPTQSDPLWSRRSSTLAKDAPKDQVVELAEAAQKTKLTKVDIRRLFSLAKNEKLVIAGAMACLFVSSAITMSVPFSLGKILDIIFSTDGVGPESMEKLKYFCLLLSGIFVLGGLANFGRVYLFNSASIRIVKDLRSNLYRALLNQETAWFDTRGTGEMVQRLSADTFFLGNSLSQNLSDGLRSTMMILVGTGMMLYTSPQLSLVSGCVVPCIAGVAVTYGRYVRKIMRKYLDKHALISKSAEERLANIKTVKAFCREDAEAKAYDVLLLDAMKLAYDEVKAKSMFFGFSGFAGNIIIISVLYYGGTLVISQQLTIGALTSFILYATYTAVSLNGISNFYTEMNKGVGAGQRLWEILERKYEIPYDVGIVPTVKPRGEIVFSNVQFSFPTRLENPVLKDISISLTPGQTTAIVGRSGSGKTTIASLLLRLYDPQSGSIKVDGMDLKDLSPIWLRNHIGAVNQEPVLFSGTIKENILYGLNPGTEVSDEDFEKIIVTAHVEEFVKKLPKGLDTLVGQRGIMLSGGQKQRVAIARALIKDPTILIFDEATSALDSESEELVQRALESVSKGRTVLTIAHRLSTIRNAHKIVVIDNGRVSEVGPYEDLMTNETGIFKDLVKKQAFISSF